MTWKTLDETDYSIRYPEEWELDQSGQMGSTFFLFSPLETNQDKFRDNVNLFIQDLSGLNIDLNNYAEISEEQLRTLITNFTLIESKKMKTNSDEFHRVIFTGDQGIFQLRYEQIYWLKNNKAYALTFTCEQDKFSYLEEVVEVILNSFSFNQ